MLPQQTLPGPRRKNHPEKHLVLLLVLLYFIFFTYSLPIATITICCGRGGLYIFYYTFVINYVFSDYNGQLYRFRFLIVFFLQIPSPWSGHEYSVTLFKV